MPERLGSACSALLALRLREVGYDHPDAVSLVGDVQRVYLDRYGSTDLTPVLADEFAPPLGLFLVGYAAGVPVACGGWRRRSEADDPELRDGDIELKRMYVVESMRGHGFARRVLAELERRARATGGRRMVLETGTRQPEAMALYRSAGYRKMTGFGVYRDEALSVCFAKPLA